MGILSRRLSSGVLFAAAMALASAGCTQDLGLDDALFACASDAECIAGFHCGAEGICLAGAAPDVLQTEDGDTLGPPDTGPEVIDPCVERECTSPGEIFCEPDGSGYAVCGSEAGCANDVWSEPVGGCFIAGACVGPGETHPDNPCQSCQPEESTDGYENLKDGSTCDDGKACTEDTTCTAAICGNGASVDCDDGIACTSDGCENEEGCQHPVESGCLIDGSCVDEGVSNPDNPCELCDGAEPGAWSPVEDGLTCEDDNPCTEADTCQAGACTSGEAVSCADDDNPCTQDVCDAQSEVGCSYPWVESGTPCGSVINGTETCQGEFCVQACLEGYGDCNIDWEDGCEVLTDGDPAHCGGCDLACDPGQVCEAAGCAEACSGDLANCSGSCKDTDTDALHCGACGIPCPGGDPSLLATCAAGECDLDFCPEGFWDINGNAADGCEYPCMPSGEEICDGDDNDCDGFTDEGTLCKEGTTSQEAFCIGGVCNYGDCAEDTWNLDSKGTCEYACTLSSDFDDCGLGDEDCDDVIDEDGTDCLPPESAVLEVAVGSYHACARRQDGTLWCWGSQGICSAFGGPLGPSTGSEHPTPEQVPLSEVTDVDAGSVSTCVVRGEAGEVWCWGYNNYNQLGVDGPAPVTSYCYPNPVQAVESTGLPLEGALQVATGTDHACALMADSSLRCWGGSPSVSQLMGFPGGGDSGHPPQTVLEAEDGAPFTGVVAVAAGENFSCALKADQSAWCWGSGFLGKLGVGDVYGRPYPSPVVDGQDEALGGLVELEAGRTHACARDDTGQLWCWGGNGRGQLSVGSTADSDHALPATLAFGTSLGAITHLGLGSEHSCAANDAGVLYCWGRNSRGQAGDDTETSLLSAQAVEGLDSILGIDGGVIHTCAWTTGGAAFCWGANYAGLLGLGIAPEAKPSPTEVVGLEGALEVGIGNRHGCARTSEGVYCWGANDAYGMVGYVGDSGMLGTGTSLPLPHPLHPVITSDGDILQGTDLAVGGYHSILRIGDESWRWGAGDQGQLGHGEALVAAAAQAGDTGPLAGITDHDAGRKHSCAVEGATGRVLCQGDNAEGQLGDGKGQGDNDLADPVLTENDAVLLGMGALGLGNHSCAVGSQDGSVFCWGDQDNGQTGNGEKCYSCDALKAVQVIHEDESPLLGMATVAVGGDHSCALSADGLSLWCWGRDVEGQLGTGSEDGGSDPYPRSVALPPGGALGVTLGADHSCLWNDSGKVYCWGSNAEGQLGEGSGTQQDSPYLLPGITDAIQVAAASDGNTTCAVHATGKVSCWGEGKDGQLGDNTLLRFAPTQVVGMDVLCPEGFVDTNQNIEDGCGYECTVSGAESCDGEDDEDCDDQVDEGFDLATDVENCGACGSPCEHETVLDWSCQSGSCVAQVCADGQWDDNKDPEDGCEYACVATPDPAELCDGVDNDCDGETDEAALCTSENTTSFATCDAGECLPAECPEHTWNLDQEGFCEYVCVYASETDDCGEGDENCDGQEDEDGTDCPLAGTAVVQMDAYGSTACALRQDGSVWCWGNNGNYFADPTASSSPVPLPAQIDLAAAVEIGTTEQAAFARHSDGTVTVWGETLNGLAGDADSTSGPTQPTAVLDPGTGAPLTGVKSLHPGWRHVCVVREDTSLWCWGYGAEDALGPGTGTEESAFWKPAPVRWTEGGDVLTGVIDACSGYKHSCAVLTAEETTVWCWGDEKAMGDASGQWSDTPKQVVNVIGEPLSGIVEVACQGANHSCGRTAEGKVYCWGEGSSGKLGNGGDLDTPYASALVIDLAGGAQVEPMVGLELEYDRSCAVGVSGKVYCWGLNSTLLFLEALPDALEASFAVQLPGIEGAAGIALTGSLQCVWHQDGSASCWGLNNAGQLGQGTVPGASLVPVVVPGIAPQDIAVGYNHACALELGTVRCWGKAGSSLGQANTLQTLAAPGSPVPQSDELPDPLIALSLAAGNGTSFALLPDGSAVAWGYNANSALGTGAGYNDHWWAKPIQSALSDATLEHVSHLAAGNQHGCAITWDEGAAWCWGSDTNGAVGCGGDFGGLVYKASQVLKAGGDEPLLDVAAIAVCRDTDWTKSHTCAVAGPEGSVWCWGYGFNGELGDGTAGGSSSAATAVQRHELAGGGPLTGIQAVAAARHTTCALAAQGDGVWCWGQDNLGQMGNGPLPANAWAVEITAFKDLEDPPLVDLVAGMDHFCALRGGDVGKVLCWGAGSQGVLGNGDSGNKTVPTLVSSLEGVVALAAGGQNTCAITADETLYCWGDNTYGQLGDGSYANYEPQPVQGLDLPAE